MKTALLASAVLAAAGVVFYFSTTPNAKASGPQPSAQKTLASQSPAKTISLPLFFEPNQGQTAPQVKFLARGAGYGLFLTADEAVLNLHRPSPAPRPALSSVIRMKLDGANSAASVSGAEPLPGKSNYFIGNDPAKWRHNIPQFARVEYKSVYPGVDLVYYGDQGQLEYDFRVAPGAEPSQIALSFQGASTHIESGDLMLSTDQGDVRFHAPRVYQRDGNAQKTVTGSFRQLADNKIGFAIGDYDHTRELVIDPVLSYSTYLGGSNGVESFVNLAVDSSGLIYLAGSTNSTDYPPTPPTTPAFQSQLGGAGAQNIFIAVINPTLTETTQSGYTTSQLLYATYLGGSGSDFPAGIAISTNLDQFTTGIDIYVAGTTSSTNFPVSTTASGGLAPFQAGPPIQPGPHGFITRWNVSAFNTSGVSTLRYSTYLSGNGADTVTGLAIDNTGNAFVTGSTTSTDGTSNGFPANPNAFQIQSNAPHQFFASEINTKGSGSLSMIYSTYLGGGNVGDGNPQHGQAVGGGIAIDASDNMYITGGTNFLPTTGPNNEAKFPLNLAYQSCLDESGQTSCTGSSSPTALDAFVAKITPKPGFALPVYCTYLGGSGDDIGYGIAVDSSGNAYVTGSTLSDNWTSTGSGFQTTYGTNGDAFIAKIGNLTGSIYPLTYFTYLGGSGVDVGQAIQVDSLQAVHVVGSTTSTDLLLTSNALQTYGGGGDAFVALISTTLSGRGVGDLLTYLGGGLLDQGTGVAIDPVFGATYVAGITQSSQSSTPPFPITANAYQLQLNGSQNAFVSKIGASSTLTVTPSTTSPSPNPVAAGTQVAFTFNIGNTGPDNASQVIFTAGFPAGTTGLATTPTAKVSTGTGSCGAVQGSTITCFIPTLAVCSTATCTSASVEVDATPAITTTAQTITVTGQATANNSGIVVTSNPPQTADPIVDFTVQASSPSPNTINAGDKTAIQIAFCPTSTHGYNATITPSETTSPSIVTATTPTFNPTSVTLSGSSCGTTTLTINTVARPVTTGSLFRHGSFYAAWLPIGGLSLVGLGIGAGRKRRRWLAAVVLGLIAGAILLQSGCGSSSSSVTPGTGTQAGTYIITIVGSAGTGASHNSTATLFVH